MFARPRLAAWEAALDRSLLRALVGAELGGLALYSFARYFPADLAVYLSGSRDLLGSGNPYLSFQGHQHGPASDFFPQYTNPPLLAILLSPLLALPRPWVGIVWAAALLAIYALAAAWLLHPLRGWWWLAAALLVLGNQATTFVLRVGNIEIVVFALLVGAGLGLQRRRPRLAGAALGLAAALKLSPLLFALWLAHRRRWDALVAMIAVAGAALLLQWWVARPALVTFLQSVLPVLERGSLNVNNQSWAGMLGRLRGDLEWTRPATLLAVAAGLLLAWALAPRAHQASSPAGQLSRELAWLTFVIVLAAPLAWQTHFVLLWWPLLLGLRQLRLAGRRWWALLLFVGWTLAPTLAGTARDQQLLAGLGPLAGPLDRVLTESMGISATLLMLLLAVPLLRRHAPES